MIGSLRQRIAKLEARVSTEPITLRMSDGSQQSISGSTRHWQRLNAAMLADDYAGPLSIELEWLGSAVTIEGANRQAFALTQALLLGGVECEVDAEELDDEGRERAHNLQLVIGSSAPVSLTYSVE
jgi:hypothetical protein